MSDDELLTTKLLALLRPYLLHLGLVVGVGVGCAAIWDAYYADWWASLQ